MQISHLSKLLKNFKKFQKWIPCHCLCQKNLSKIYELLFKFKKPLSKIIFIKYYVMCSLINSYCNHFSSMLMNVKLIVIQLELNGTGYKLVFHSYSKSAWNTWYTLICKFEKCKPNPQKQNMDMNIYHLLKILKRKIKKKIQIGKNGNRKTKFIFWNFKD
jgi:hypothetical protein